MKYGLSNIRNFKQVDYDTATTFVKQNWMKLVIILFALFIILKKDISLNFNLQAAGSSAQAPREYYQPNNQNVSLQPQPQVTATPEPVKSSYKIPEKRVEQSIVPSLPYFEPDHQLETQKTQKKIKKTAKKKKDNRANTFANLAFILNPTYAKRKNIDNEIVIQKQEIVYRYVKRFADISVEEMKKYGIPASITLAQGLLESDAGQSRLSKNNNNHFGIKCFSKKCGKGHCANFTDDTHKDFFRKYKNVWESYRAHSTFLQRDRYKHLKDLGTTDYKGWARGLKKAGYATDKKYADKLIKIIETLELHQYDE